MPVNDKIIISDYNNIRNKVINVLGTGSGTSGYGQQISSSAVTAGTSVVAASKITVNEYALLRNDIINAYRHIFGSAPTLVSPTEGNIVRYNATGTTPAQATQPVVQYDRFADQIIANRFTVHPSQTLTTNKGSQSRSSWDGGFWNNKLTCRITVSWPNATQARHFFNAGGEIRFSSSRTDPGAPSTRLQNVSWSNLLTASGTPAFGAQKPSTGFTPMNGSNFYRLTNADQIWFSRNASGEYANNVYRINARSNVVNNSSGTANTIEFLVEWIDAEVDKDIEFGRPSGLAVPPGDEVDGIITIAVTTLEASGTLVPTGTGNFSVISPTVSFGSIVQEANSTR